MIFIGEKSLRFTAHFATHLTLILALFAAVLASLTNTMIYLLDALHESYISL